MTCPTAQSLALYLTLRNAPWAEVWALAEGKE